MEEQVQIEPKPSYHGKLCPYNGSGTETECGCDECDFFLACFPDWEEMLENMRG